MSTRIAGWKRRLCLGAGQNLRYHMGQDTFWSYFKERGFGILPVFGLLLGALSLVFSALTGQWLWFGVWVALIVAVFAGFTARQRCLYRGFFRLFLWLLILGWGILGFFFWLPGTQKLPVRQHGGRGKGRDM